MFAGRTTTGTFTGAKVGVTECFDTADRMWSAMSIAACVGTSGRSSLYGPRPTSVDRALRAIRPGNTLRKPRRPYRKGISSPGDRNKRALCADAEEFAVDLLEILDAMESGTEDVALIYVVVGGGGRLSRSGGAGSWSLSVGETWLVPACLGRHRLEAEGNLRVLRVRTKA